MSVKGIYKVTVVSGGTAEMVIRADIVTALPDGALYVVGDRQKRQFPPGLWKSITIENDGTGNEHEQADAAPATSGPT